MAVGGGGGREKSELGDGKGIEGGLEGMVNGARGGWWRVDGEWMVDEGGRMYFCE